MKYNVPLHSWKHSALTASSLWATVGAKYMSTCQTETSISGAAMLVYSTHREREGERGEGNPPKTCGKTRTSHTAVSQKRLTSAHAAQPGRVSLILWSTREKKKCNSRVHPRRVQEARPMEGFVLAPRWNHPESNAYITGSSVK